MIFSLLILSMGGCAIDNLVPKPSEETGIEKFILIADNGYEKPEGGNRTNVGEPNLYWEKFDYYRPTGYYNYLIYRK